MPGMLNSRQLERLKAAERHARSTALFLRYMTQHHRGALTMVQRAARQGRRRGGARSAPSPGTWTSDQQIEIQRMQEMLRG